MPGIVLLAAALVFLHATLAEAVRRGRPLDSGLPPPQLSASEVRLAYRLMGTANPFPSDTVLRACPLGWRVSRALARATSLHPSCVFIHLLILVATTLGAVKVNFGGILGRVCNLLMIQHGAPGEGKSVALWLSLQILYYYDKLRDDRAKKAYATLLAAYKAWKEAGGSSQRHHFQQRYIYWSGRSPPSTGWCGLSGPA